MNIYQKELRHAWSKSQKAEYNRQYYQRNKDYWVEWRKEHVDAAVDAFKKNADSAIDAAADTAKKFSSKLGYPKVMNDLVDTSVSMYKKYKDEIWNIATESLEMAGKVLSDFGSSVIDAIGSEFNKTYESIQKKSMHSLESGKKAVEKALRNVYNESIDSITSTFKDLTKLFERRGG